MRPLKEALMGQVRGGIAAVCRVCSVHVFSGFGLWVGVGWGLLIEWWCVWAFQELFQRERLCTVSAQGESQVTDIFFTLRTCVCVCVQSRLVVVVVVLWEC